jgi:hypothetical protein
MNTIGLPIANVCYYYNLILDILVSFEKLSIFVKRLEIINKKYFINSQLICIVVFIVVLLIDLPYFFFYTPTVQLVYFSPNETYEFANYQLSDFTQSTIGSLVLYIQYAVRDIMPLLFLIGLNVALVYQLNLYMSKKIGITNQVGRVEGMTQTATLIQTTLTSRLENKKKPVDANAAKNKKIRKSQISTSIMVILICVFSFIKSSIILISIVYSSVNQSIVANLLGTFSDYLIYSITTLNFFIVLMFDRNFNDFFIKNLRSRVEGSGQH